jgi:uncharacterized protein YajQ (UPF0234 family)
MPSFDVVSKVSMEEVENAFQQTRKEIVQRFDFRGTGTELEKTDEGIVLRSLTEQRLQAALEVFQEKCIKRKVSLRSLDPGAVEPGAKGTFRQLVAVKEGIPEAKAKEIVKLLKDSKLKVQGGIHGDTVRVTGRDRDTLQEAIRLMRGKDLGLDLQFINFRD